VSTAEPSVGGIGLGPLGELLGASNALVVSGKESQSGRPVAVFGPQTGYFTPQLLMELDLHAPKTAAGPAIDARGATFAGVNLYIQLGRGRDYAWSATSAGQDIVDTFALRLCGPGGIKAQSYLYRGKCTPIEKVERTNTWAAVPACGGCSGAERLSTDRTKLGLGVGRARLKGRPVIYVSLRSTYFHEADSAIGFADFNSPDRVKSAASYQKAASLIGFTFNWFYADKGDVTYFNSGNNPERARGIDTNFPVRACPPDSSPGRCEYEWKDWNPGNFTADYTPFAEHPRETNPDKGYLTSWNNKQAPKYRAADDNFSYGSIHRSEPLDDRIKPRIAGGKKITAPTLVDAMEDAGTVDLRGDKVLPFMLEALGPQGGTRRRRLEAARLEGRRRPSPRPLGRLPRRSRPLSLPAPRRGQDHGRLVAEDRRRAVQARPRSDDVRSGRRHDRHRRRAERQRDACRLLLHRRLVRLRREGPAQAARQAGPGSLLAYVLRRRRPRALPRDPALDPGRGRQPDLRADLRG